MPRSFSRQWSRRAAILLAPAPILSVLPLAGCIVEKTDTRRGILVRPSSNAQAAGPNAATAPNLGGAAIGGGTANAGGSPVSGVATRAGTVTAASRVSLGTLPLGNLDYDGLGLPLPAPDASFFAVQVGSPPPWPALFAQQGGTVPAATRLAVFQRRGATLAPVMPAVNLPLGLILGRAATAQSFLVEAPRERDSRWIGAVDWATASVRWLVQNTRTNAHAITFDDGWLLLVRRRQDSPGFELVALSPSGEESVFAPPIQPVVAGATPPPPSFSFPLISADRRTVAAVASTGQGTLELWCIDWKPGFGELLAQHRLAERATDAAAFLAIASTQPVPAAADSDARSRADALAAQGSPVPTSGFSVAADGGTRLTWLDARSSARWLFPSDANAATPLVRGQLGWLVGSETSLGWRAAENVQPESASSGSARVVATGLQGDELSQPMARLMRGPAIAKGLDLPSAGLIAGPGPDPRKPQVQLQLIELRPEASGNPASAGPVRSGGR